MGDPTRPGKTRHDVESLAAGAVVVGPGDTLLITFRDKVPADVKNGIRAALRATMPGVELVCVDGVAGVAAYRPNDVEVAEPADHVPTRSPAGGWCCGEHMLELGDTPPPCDCQPTVPAGPDVAAYTCMRCGRQYAPHRDGVGRWVWLT